MSVIEIRFRLKREVKWRREAAGMSQQELAERLGVVQPRVAKIEAGGRGVNLENLVSAYLATGASLADLGAVIGSIVLIEARSPARPAPPTPKRSSTRRRSQRAGNPTSRKKP